MFSETEKVRMDGVSGDGIVKDLNGILFEYGKLDGTIGKLDNLDVTKELVLEVTVLSFLAKTL